ncbi:hypothetical protein U1Q18_032026, partial [Sarracenia purpurea var. burkii]
MSVPFRVDTGFRRLVISFGVLAPCALEVVVSALGSGKESSAGRWPESPLTMANL